MLEWKIKKSVHDNTEKGRIKLSGTDTVTISMFIVLFTSGPHLRHNYHGNKTLETMLSGFVEFVGHRLNRPVLLHLCVSCSSYKQRHMVSGVGFFLQNRR